MARPTLGDSETERLQLKITKDEIEAIDDWRYSNRVPSRSEAVRRLIQIGLFVEQELEQVVDTATDGAKILSQHSEHLSEVFRLVINRDTYGMMFDRDQLWDIFSVAREQADEAEKGVHELQGMIVTLYNAITAMVEAKSLHAGKRKSQEVIDEANAAVEQAIERKAERDAESEENRYLYIYMSEASDEEKAAYEALPEDEKDAFLEAKIAALREDEKKDPDAFAKRHGIDTRKFWEKPEWLELLDKRRKMGEEPK